jgi:hypothetical protein
VATSALLIAGLFGAGAGAEAAPPSGKVSFSEPTLFPSFGPNVHDYVVRCNDGPVTVQAHATGGWEAKIGDPPYRSGSFSETVPLGAGRLFIVTVRRVGGSQLYRYHVRCLPDDFPKYTFTRSGPVSPKYFTVENVISPSPSPSRRYAMIFDNHGVPVWWYQAATHDARVLADGTVLWFRYGSAQYEIHRLDGGLVRTLNAVGQNADHHDLRLLDNGDHLVAANVRQSHVDTSAYGGSSDATVVNTELQQVSPGGTLVWSWRSQDHISLAETGRWWPWAIDHNYEINHWNSIEPAGDAVIASFKHLDAVYKVSKSTGNIVWKLGGTRTPDSLTVVGDSHAYPVGGQHDARVLSDGTLSVFDNRTNLANPRPRAVRYRIDQAAGTATLVQSITDPDVTASSCCGSARRLPNGDSLIGWGGRTNPIGGYKADGERTFLLQLRSNRSYRAQPAPSGAVSAQDLRQGMNAMYGGP